jgi:hypothetical protein
MALGKMVHAGGRPFASLIDDNFDIDVEIAQDLEVYFAWAPPLSTEPRDAYELLAGQESISPNNVASEFTALMELETKEYESFDEVRVLEGNDFGKLDRARQGIIPQAIVDEVEVVNCNGEDDGWGQATLISSLGVSYTLYMV